MNSKHKQLTKPRPKTVTLPDREQHLLDSTNDSQLRLSRSNFGVGVQRSGTFSEKSYSQRELDFMHSYLRNMESQGLSLLSVTNGGEAQLHNLRNENKALKQYVSELYFQLQEKSNNADVFLRVNRIKEEISSFKQAIAAKAYYLKQQSTVSLDAIISAVTLLKTQRDREISAMMYKIVGGESRASDLLFNENQALITRCSDLYNYMMTLKSELLVYKQLALRLEDRNYLLQQYSREDQLRMIGLYNQQSDAVLTAATLRRQVGGIRDVLLNFQHPVVPDCMLQLYHTLYAFSAKMIAYHSSDKEQIGAFKNYTDELTRRLEQYRIDFERQLTELAQKSRFYIENYQKEQEMIVYESKATFKQLIDTQKKISIKNAEIANLQHYLEQLYHANVMLKAANEAYSQNASEMRDRCKAQYVLLEERDNTIIYLQRERTQASVAGYYVREAVSAVFRAVHDLVAQVKYELDASNTGFPRYIMEYVGGIIFQHQALKANYNLSRERFTLSIEEGNNRIYQLQADYYERLADERRNATRIQTYADSQNIAAEKRIKIAIAYQEELAAQNQQLRNRDAAYGYIMASQSEKITAQMTEIERLRYYMLGCVQRSEDKKTAITHVVSVCAIELYSLRQNLRQLKQAFYVPAQKTVYLALNAVSALHQVITDSEVRAKGEKQFSENEISRIKAESETTMYRLRYEIARYVSECDMQRDEIKKASKKTADLQLRLDKCEDDAHMAAESSKAIMRVKQAEISYLTTDNAGLRAHVQMLSQSAAEAYASAEALQREAQSAAYEAQLKRSMLVYLQQKLLGLKSALVGCKDSARATLLVQASLDAVEKRISEMCNTKIAAIYQNAALEIDTMRETVNKAYLKAKHAENAVSAANNEIERLSKYLNAAQEDSQQKVKNLTADGTRLAEALQQAKLQVQQAAEQVEKYQYESNYLHLALVQKNASISNLQAENRQLAQKSLAAQNEVNDVVREVSEWKSNIQRNMEAQKTYIQMLSQKLTELE